MTRPMIKQRYRTSQLPWVAGGNTFHNLRVLVARRGACNSDYGTSCKSSYVFPGIACPRMKAMRPWPRGDPEGEPKYLDYSPDLKGAEFKRGCLTTRATGSSWLKRTSSINDRYSQSTWIIEVQISFLARKEYELTICSKSTA